MTWKSSKSQVAFAMSIKATEQDKKKKMRMVFLWWTDHDGLRGLVLWTLGR